jgi:heptosyltransferase-2
MKVLIIQQKMIGDVLTSSLLFEALRKKYPKAELHYLIKKNTVPVVKSNPYIDKIIIDGEDSAANKLSLLRFIEHLRKEHYTAVVDVYSKIGSALITYGTRSPLRVGLKKWYTSFLYTNTRAYKETPESPSGKAIRFRMDLLKPLGISGEESYRPKILLSTEEKVEAKAFMKKSGVDLSRTVIMCNVMGSSINKTYPLPFFAQVLTTISETCDAQFLFNYMPSQYNQVEELMALCTPDVKNNVKRSCYAQNLSEFIAITSFCDVLIGNEGGAVHMAKAVNIPTFAIFSPQIKKEAWFDQETLHDTAVHLQDYKPELFEHFTDKNEVLKANTQLYEQFSPDYFEEILIEFLDKNLCK